VLAESYHDVRRDAEELGYTHLLSRAKSDEEVRKRLHGNVKAEFPDRYATIELTTN